MKLGSRRQQRHCQDYFQLISRCCRADINASSSPAGTEVCDARDNDCDGDTDEGVTATSKNGKEVLTTTTVIGSLSNLCIRISMLGILIQI